MGIRLEISGSCSENLRMKLLHDKTPKIYLSRRNLEALLSKLDRLSKGEDTACAILKMQHDGAEYRQTMPKVLVVAVEDEAYYCAQRRPAGAMHPADEERLKPPSTGLASPYGDF